MSLAWFSSLTHLATLSSLRDYFRERQTMAICRAGFMGVVLVLLCISFGTTGYVPQFGSSESPSWPAKCLFSTTSMSKVGASDTEANYGHRPGFNRPLIIVSVAFLLISYLTRIVRIFKPTAGLARQWFEAIPRDAIKRWYRHAARKAENRPEPAMRRLWNFFSFAVAVLYTVSKALYDIGESMLWEVCCTRFIPLSLLSLS